MEFVPNEKAMPIRVPSTANLMVDSADRKKANYPLCNDFQITKMNSILNGFFTRVGTTEVVFEWTTPNISEDLNNREIVYNIDGPVPFNEIINIPDGFYNVAEILSYLFSQTGDLNSFTPTTGVTWDVNSPGNGTAVVSASVVGPAVTVRLSGPLMTKLFPPADLNGNELTLDVPVAPTFVAVATIPGGIDLRPVRYIDIVCNQLTNNQAVKDASTAPIVRDVLCRWYFDYDNQGPTDQFGYPILMGYTPFYLRRLYNPPKQIQWQTNIPVGNLSLQLYDDKGLLLDVVDTTNYLLTLQVSEN